MTLFVVELCTPLFPRLFVVSGSLYRYLSFQLEKRVRGQIHVESWDAAAQKG